MRLVDLRWRIRVRRQQSMVHEAVTPSDLRVEIYAKRLLATNFGRVEQRMSVGRRSGGRDGAKVGQGPSGGRGLSCNPGHLCLVLPSTPRYRYALPNDLGRRFGGADVGRRRSMNLMLNLLEVLGCAHSSVTDETERLKEITEARRSSVADKRGRSASCHSAHCPGGPRRSPRYTRRGVAI
jgi:hypothetical protein